MFTFQIASAGDNIQLRGIVLSACDFLMSCGFTKPIPLLKHEDFPSIIHCVGLHMVILQVMAMLDSVNKC